MTITERRNEIIEELSKRKGDESYPTKYIEELASNILGLIGFNATNSPINIEKLVRDVFEFEIREKDLNKRTLAEITISQRGIKKIYFNKKADQCSKRFFLAYQLGNYLLNYLRRERTLFTDKWAFNENLASEEKQQALTFAMEILMPEDVILYQMYNMIGFNTAIGSNSISKHLSEVFEVEESLVLQRIDRLYKDITKYQKEEVMTYSKVEYEKWPNMVEYFIRKNDDYITLSHYPLKAAERLAKNVSKAMYSQNPKSKFIIEDGVEKFGFEIRIRDYEEQLLGEIFIDEKEKIIIINKKRPEMHRFMLAYQLGYYLLCYVGSEKEQKKEAVHESFNESEGSIFEHGNSQALIFAMGILMPEWKIRCELYHYMFENQRNITVKDLLPAALIVTESLFMRRVKELYEQLTEKADKPDGEKPVKKMTDEQFAKQARIAKEAEIDSMDSTEPA